MALSKWGEDGPLENPNFLAVSHGRMIINVPYSVFQNRTYHLIPEKWKEQIKLYDSEAVLTQKINLGYF